MIISDEARSTRNKFVSQLYDMNEAEREERYNEVLRLIPHIRGRMEKDVGEMLASLENSDSLSLFDTWFYNIKRIVNDYEDWFIYKDVAIVAKALIEYNERGKESNDGRD